MTKKRLIELFKYNKDAKGSMSNEIITNIITNIKNIKSGVCNNGVDYYLSVDLDALSNSTIDDSIIYKMLESGWKLSSDSKNLEVIY